MYKHHIVFILKHQWKMIYRKDLLEMIKVLIIDNKRTRDARLCIFTTRIPLKYSVSSFMVYLKGKSDLMMFDRHVN